MDLVTLLWFIPACFALNMTPGPNNLLAMNNSRSYGFGAALYGGAGRIIAFAIMIALTASGLAVILYASQTLFMLIKVAGALYLFWLAFQLWRSEAIPLQEGDTTRTYFGLAKQEFLLAAGNPKAILIFTAFLPQFVDIQKNTDQQFFALGATFLMLELLTISIYALFGLYLRNWFARPQMAKAFNRVCAVFLSISGANLLFSRQ
uniref:LysE family translocator n=1 Tax=Thaumasiovibrio occultus TaxID=1891184 RepID=UPI000B363669|nr:LysE family translocator [Thaumasiovibrio occultus]